LSAGHGVVRDWGDGRFAWNASAFDHRVASPGRPTSAGTGAAHRQYAAGDNRIDIVRDDGARSSPWWATRNEWLGLIDVTAGLEVKALYGGFAGEPFTDDNQEYVFITRRRAHRFPAWSRRVMPGPKRSAADATCLDVHSRFTGHSFGGSD
jgi:hypothetical protein